jgi:hypothetical protein
LKKNYSREVRETEEFERSEISEREEAAQETIIQVQLSQCMVENLSRHELFDSLFEDDEEAEALLSVGSGVEELIEEYEYFFWIFLDFSITLHSATEKRPLRSPRKSTPLDLHSTSAGKKKSTCFKNVSITDEE